MKHRSLFSLLLAVTASALFAARVAAQSNPDFSNVNDILHGNRTLLNITDLVVSKIDLLAYDQIWAAPITTSNSKPTGSGTGSWSYSGADWAELHSFSARMLNQPQSVIITTAHGGGTLELVIMNGNQFIAFNPQNPAPPFNYYFFQPLQAGDDPLVTSGATADFTLEGYEDLALSFDDGRLLVVAATDRNNFWNYYDAQLRSSIASLDVLKDMTAGDFKGDGKREIAGLTVLPSGGLKLVIYAVNTQSLAITPASSLVLTTSGANNANPITHASIARGKFNTLAHDQLTVAFATDSGPSTVEIIDFAANSLTPIENVTNALVASNVGISGGFIQVKTGQFALPGNPYDQIVFHSSSPAVSGGKFFEIISVDSTSLALTANTPMNYDNYGCSYGLAIGNFDHQQPDRINPDKNEHNPNAQIAHAYGSCNPEDPIVSIYSADPKSFGLTSDSENSVSGLPGGTNPPQNIAVVAADLQGRSAVLGAPTKVTIDNTRTTVITAAPPMHIDYITPVGASKPEVLNLSYIPDGFNNSYQLTQESKQGGSTTHKLSWSAGAAETVSGGFQIGNPDAGEGAKFTSTFHAAQDFTGSTEANGSNFSTTDFNVSVATRDADSVFYDNSRLNIWVYPVLGQKVPSATPSDCPAAGCPLTIQFSGPDQIDTGNISADIASWYQPPWEFGNVFSYPATKDQLALIYPDLAATQLSSDLTFYTDTNSKKVQANWSSGSTQGSTTSTANNFSFDLSGTYVESEGIPEVGFETGSVSLNVSGSFGFKNLQTQTASMKASSGIGIQAVGLFRDPPNYAYAVTPVILGNAPPTGIGDSTQPPAADIETIGPLKTAFVADPLANSAGAWWTGPSSPYRAAPDVALNHSSRWILTEPALSNPIPDNCGNTGTGASQMDCADIAPYMPSDPWDSEFYRILGFFITPADKAGAGPQLGFATAGDKLDLGVRVYNYSLAPMSDGTQVHVRFYGMPWDTATSTSVGDSLSASNSFLIGETVLDPIPSFSDSPGAPLNWVIAHTPTPFDTTPYEGKSLVFWVVVWMQDANGILVPEIEGHGLKSVPATLTSLADVPVEMATDRQGNPASYSNNVGLYHSVFNVLPPPNELAAIPPSNPAEITLARVFASKEHIRPGEVDLITALLKAGPNGATGLKVYFYDGDPDNGGKLIALETASVQGNSTTQVRIPYHAPTDGVHRIWALVNKGKPYKTEGHTETIMVKWPRS